MEDKLYDVWFSCVDIENQYKINLLEKYSAKQIWKFNFNKLIEMGINEKSILNIINSKNIKEYQKYFKYMQENNIKLICIRDKKYPSKLQNINNKPAYLYIRGNEEILDDDSVAIVGCRICTNMGKNISRNIAREIADKNINIVSGLALGIDKYAHLGALDSDIGKTIAVLGCGVSDEDVYPYQNKRIFERILENGGTIVSEYPIGTKPEKKHFPARNRIISGLSDKVIVVEAKKRSGSLITANWALEQGKDVFAVPRKYICKKFNRN